ncbi:hypothetical protein [Streptomyces tauricus]
MNSENVSASEAVELTKTASEGQDDQSTDELVHRPSLHDDSSPYWRR